jgi:hypothetical protein
VIWLFVLLIGALAAWVVVTNIRRPPKKQPQYHQCLADNCDQPTVPQDGPFCPRHNWSNWMSGE